MPKRDDERRNATTPRQEDLMTAGEISEAMLRRSGPSGSSDISPEPEQPAVSTERVRLRLDVPEWLRICVVEAAKAEDTSISQMAAFLLAVGLTAYYDGDLRETLDQNKFLARSLRWGSALDLTTYADRLLER